MTSTNSTFKSTIASTLPASEEMPSPSVENSSTISRKNVIEEMTSQSTAAAKVFAVPELLEKVLYELALEDGRHGEWVSDPATSLFTLKRVDQTFRDAIESSIKLRRLMWLSPEPPSSESKYIHDRCAPMDWLFYRFIRLFSPTVEDDGNCRVLRVVLTTTLADWRKGRPRRDEFHKFDERHQYPNASWRHMRAVLWCEEVPLEVVAMAPGKFPFKNIVGRFRADETLGEVYDNFAKLAEGFPALYSQKLREARKKRG